jgi:hypothetical protein
VLKGGTFHRPARKAAIIVGGLDEPPALACVWRITDLCRKSAIRHTQASQTYDPSSQKELFGSKISKNPGFSDFRFTSPLFSNFRRAPPRSIFEGATTEARSLPLLWKK